mmetsp:Transcript_66104/g.186789  ORF Transcript_66104/g.186789 Transcript_66104/m.186789 type:complete len:387 (+) Transcript_66104:928-2088(+)
MPQNWNLYPSSSADRCRMAASCLYSVAIDSTWARSARAATAKRRMALCDGTLQPASRRPVLSLACRHPDPRSGPEVALKLSGRNLYKVPHSSAQQGTPMILLRRPCRPNIGCKPAREAWHPLSLTPRWARMCERLDIRCSVMCCSVPLPMRKTWAFVAVGVCVMLTAILRHSKEFNPESMLPGNLQEPSADCDHARLRKHRLCLLCSLSGVMEEDSGAEVFDVCGLLSSSSANSDSGDGADAFPCTEWPDEEPEKSAPRSFKARSKLLEASKPDLNSKRHPQPDSHFGGSKARSGPTSPEHIEMSGSPRTSDTQVLVLNRPKTSKNSPSDSLKAIKYGGRPSSPRSETASCTHCCEKMPLKAEKFFQKCPEVQDACTPRWGVESEM